MSTLLTRDRTVVSQLRDGLAKMIQDQKLQLGDKLPSEEKLCAEFRVSRNSLREALKLLEQDGIIRVEHGRGRFVMAGAALHVERPITTFESVTDMIAGFGYNARTEVVSANELPADETVASGLHCEIETPVIRIERLRYDKSIPIMYSLDFVRSSDLFNRAKDFTGSLVELLKARGMAPVASTAKVSATLLPEDVIRLHKLEDFGPALLITETCFSAEGYPVLFARDYHHSAYFTFSLTRR